MAENIVDICLYILNFSRVNLLMTSVIFYSLLSDARKMVEKKRTDL